MALEDQDGVNSNFDDDKFMIEYEELLKDINKLDEKNTSLKKKVFELKKELDEINEINCYIYQNYFKLKSKLILFIVLQYTSPSLYFLYPTIS